jgi:poly [ADP-ribose] polymerase 2/3/4
MGGNSNAAQIAKEQGCISTWGVGRTAPKGWKDAGCVHEDLKGVNMPDVSVEPGDTNEPNAFLQYNEYIVYDVSQVRLRYLLRVAM